VIIRYQVLRVSVCWQLYKKPSPSFLFLVFLEFLCQKNFLHNQIGFLNTHSCHCMATVYIHYMFFFLCNSIFSFIQYTWEFHLSLLLYIYIYACISFWLISLYLWPALIFLFNIVYYRFTPLRNHTSQHYTSWQRSSWPIQHFFIFQRYFYPLTTSHVMQPNINKKRT
jgi:hypothetical protein